MLSYPYSTRELVNIVRHIAMFPDDNITTTLENVFAFDSFDPEVRQSITEAFNRHAIPLGTDSGSGVRNSLAPAAGLAQAIESSTLARPAESTALEVAVSTAALAVDWKKNLGQQPGWHPSQLKQMADKQSARTDRFAEEVLGFSIAGYADEPCEAGMVALPDNSLAVLSQQNVLVLADPTQNIVRTIPLNNGAAEAFTVPSSPPLAADTAGRVRH